MKKGKLDLNKAQEELSNDFAYDIYDEYEGDEYQEELDEGAEEEEVLDAYTSGLARKMAMTQAPLIINVTNTDTTNSAKFTLFGHDEFAPLNVGFSSQDANGNPVATGGVVQISSLNPDTTYDAIVTTTAREPFATSILRFESATSSVLSQVLQVAHKTLEGRSVKDPLVLGAYKDEYQLNQSLITVPFVIYIDGQSNIKGVLPPSSELTITIFLANKVSTKNVLFGRSGVVAPPPASSTPALPKIGKRPVRLPFSARVRKVRRPRLF